MLSLLLHGVLVRLRARRAEQNSHFRFSVLQFGLAASAKLEFLSGPCAGDCIAHEKFCL